MTVKRDTEENTWHFVVLEEDREVATLLSIRKFTSEQWADPDIRGVYFILVGKEHINGTVYGAKIHRVDEAYAPLKLDIETVRQYFKLLDLNTK